MGFTATELEAMRRADAEIEASFMLTDDEINLSNKVDGYAKADERAKEIDIFSMNSTQRYRYLNKEKFLKQRMEYYWRYKESDKHESYKKKANETRKQWEQRNVMLYASEQSKIAKARIARGWSKGELARRTGVTQPAVSKWESGKVRANWAKLCAAMPELMEEIV